MAAFETGEFIFVDGRNWSYVVDSIVDKVERKTVDRTAIASRVVQMMRIPFSMETLEIEARYHPNEPGIQHLFRDGETIERLDWAISGPGAGGSVDTFKDLILSEGLKKTNTLTDLVKQSVPLHVNGERQTGNRLLGYYELRDLGPGTYNLFDGSMAPAKVQNYIEGAPNEIMDWGAASGLTDPIEVTYHFPSFSLAYTGTALGTWARAAVAPDDAGELQILPASRQIKLHTSNNASADADQSDGLDLVVAGTRIKLTDPNSVSVTVELGAAPAAPDSDGIETFTYTEIPGGGEIASLAATGDFTVEVRNTVAPTSVAVNIMSRAALTDDFAEVAEVAGTNAVAAGISPGGSGSIHTWRSADTPRVVTISRPVATALGRYMGVQVVTAGVGSSVSFDVAIIAKRG